MVSGTVSVARGRGAIASVSREASLFALNVLRDGGNAFDAAFALAFGLAVCHPQAGNLGGGGYLIFKPARENEPLVFNYRERSPRGMKREHFLGENGAVDPDKTSFGPASICVPGTVQAFFQIQERYGVLDQRDLLRGLSKLARDGIGITAYQAQCLNRLGSKLRRSPESRLMYVRDETAFREGDRLSNEHLADTFDILAREGVSSFLSGRIAEKIEGDLARNGGFVTVRDLMDYEVTEMRPIGTELNGTTVWTVPPEGGGAILLEILNLLNRDAFKRLELFSSDYYHFIAQAAKIAFIDRMVYMGDCVFEDIDAYASIFDTQSMDGRFNVINRNRDIPTEELVSILYGDAFAAEAGLSSGSETTHFSIVDAQGNGVSNSYTLNLRYGSKWSIAGTGMLMNGSVDSFSFVPGAPNYFGVMGNKMNLFAAGKRPASNMAPVLATKDGRIELLIGSPGGPTIPTSLSSILFSVLVYGADPRMCITKGRVHHQAWPDVLYLERNKSLLEKFAKLKSKEYNIEERNEPIGDMHVVMRSGKKYLALSDYRREGFAAAHE
jgi:gamma-glutamyltranspeptidase/glutathione hydrolase